MASPVARSPRRRRLGALLRRLRKDAGRSGETLAKSLGVSQSHLSRVELGDTAATVDLVERWARECGASEDDRREAIEMAEAVSVEFTTWRTATASGLAALQRELAAGEAAATVISAWVPMLVPGLLQTASYTHHLITGEHPERGP